ncbi:MAG: TetR/AcrR family transcriptional regulator [Erysipelotrichaceae bacterium]|nr:TetR/AcrR family transcriptional regulator [Erysipelotrichaceae bacterium]
MPPKPKFTREEIISAALKIADKQGIDKLTARELGKKLGSSSRPIFTVFKDMDELKREVKKKSYDLLQDYLAEAEHYQPLYKQAIKETIRFAVEHPNLFEMVFLSEDRKTVNFEEMTIRYKDIIDRYSGVLKQDYQLDDTAIRALFKHSCVYVYGIGIMCAGHVCTFTDEQLNDTLGEVFMAMLMYAKSGKLDEKTPIPVRID